MDELTVSECCNTTGIGDDNGLCRAITEDVGCERDDS
jgi:hypothetical protein